MRALAFPRVVSVNHCTAAPEASSEKFFRPFDMHGYRRKFPDLWAAFLTAHFRDAQHVAFIFSVTERTAQNWLHGIGSPRPEFVMQAVKNIPGAAMMLEVA
jgi:hypothetical protein